MQIYCEMGCANQHRMLHRYFKDILKTFKIESHPKQIINKIKVSQVLLIIDTQ